MAKTSGVVEVSSLHRTEVYMSHRNARLTIHGRRPLIERVRSGRPIAHVTATRATQTHQPGSPDGDDHRNDPAAGRAERTGGGPMRSTCLTGSMQE